jgi:hypothetical protein
VVRPLRSWWHDRDRNAKAAFAGISALVAGAVAVRLWLMAAYNPGFLGFADSSVYALATYWGGFGDIQHPAGYSLFLYILHSLSRELWVTVAVQHITGIAAGLLLYKAVGRTGAPPWLGLLPAAVVFFGGTGLLLEHSLLADPLLSFLQAVIIYMAIRALYDPGFRWPLLAGIVIGLSVWVKIAAISNAILIPIVLICATQGRVARRLLRAAIALTAVAGMIVIYVAAQYDATGYLGYVQQGPWALYGRVTTFVDCSKFTPPPGTRFLCPPEPIGHRAGQGYYEFAATAPAVKRFGPSYFPTPRAGGLLKAFSVAAIEHEPIAYAKAIAGSLGRYVFPREGEGDTPQSLRVQLLTPVTGYPNKLIFKTLYSDPPYHAGSASETRPLAQYESYTRVQGPLLIFLLAAAIGGLICLTARTRWAAAIFTLTALASITFAVAGDGYDARYAYPTFGPLAAGAALGAWGIWSRVSLVRHPKRNPVRANASLDEVSSV